MPSPKLSSAVAFLSLCAAATAQAQLTPIGPFQGEFSENFNRFSTNQAVQVLDVFTSRGVIRNLSPGGSVKVELSSSLGGDLVQPRSGWMMGQLGIARWQFNAPARRFGGYFENNSGADDATLHFYDASLSLIGSVVADIPAAGGEWVWNGWESSVPFTRIEVVGNGVINGFIWYEDMQLSRVPEPSTLALLCAGMLPAVRRR